LTVEERRLANAVPLLADLKALLKDKLDRDICEAEKTLPIDEINDEKEYLQKTYNDKLSELMMIFARADKEYEKREVPDYLLDPISFNLFVDPVISKSGQTFEKSWILQHLKTSKTDPFSRQPLTKDDLVPNLQLKAAAEDFIHREGTF
jgi:STIP1 family protein 1